MLGFNSAKALMAAMLGFAATGGELPKPKASKLHIILPTYRRERGTHGSSRRRRFKSLKAKGML